METETEEPMRPKALSSPDFMKSYQPAYNEERDWPQLDNDEVDHDIIENGDENGIRQRRKRLDTDHGCL